MNRLSFKKAFNVPRCDSEVECGEEIYKFLLSCFSILEFCSWEGDLVSC